MTNRNHDWWTRAALLALLLAVAVVVRATLAPFIGHKFDIASFIVWAETIREHGLAAIYDINPNTAGFRVNYPPVFLYVLWGLAHTVPALTIALVKAPAIFVDLLLGGLVWYALRTQSFIRQLVATTFVLLNPALFLISSFWGQVDNLYSLFAALAVWAAVRSRWALGGLLAALAVLTKMQAIVIIPVLVALLFISPHRRRAVCQCVGTAALSALVLLAPFLATGRFSVFAQSFFGVVKQYAYLTMNAMNMWWPVTRGELVSDDVRFFGISAFAIGIGLVIAAWIWAGSWVMRRHTFPDVMFAATFCALAFFFFATEMHERYLFPVFIFLPFALGAYWRSGLVLLGMLSLSFVANITYVLFPHLTSFSTLSGASRFFMIDWWWLWNAVALAIMIVIMWRELYAKTSHHIASIQ